MFQTFIQKNKTFTFKLFLQQQIWFCQQYLGLPFCKHHTTYLTLLLESKMSQKNFDFQTLWNLHFPPLEPETSSLFWLDTSVDIALTGQL
jgi:hypothetical protein